MARSRWALSAESITAAAAVVAALVALAVGVWENAEQRRHNRLSVFPSLDYIAELRVRTEDQDTVRQAVIRIVNEGVGPAVIDEVGIRVRDPAGVEREYRSSEEAEPALEAWGVVVRSRADFGEGAVMGVGRERDLVSFSFPAGRDPQELTRSFTRVLEHLRIVIVYHSIYGDPHRAVFEPG
jgi:hypothetical protein